jgi:UDPglucose--hexose-1-phosphate uridylyltransferase
MIQESITKLVQYGLETGLITEEDAIYTANRLLELLKLDTLSDEAEAAILSYQTGDAAIVAQLEGILGAICDYAYEQGILEENTVGYRDLFDTKVMSLLVARPSEVIRQFQERYAQDPRLATDAHYKFSQDTDYIRRYRIAKDQKWIAPTEYGDLDITINLSKPEKDPKAIAAAKFAAQTSYPKCLLCRENEGYAGRLNHPARGNHRIIPVTINGSQWGFQYSPYVYYNEHCIVFN